MSVATTPTVSLPSPSRAPMARLTRVELRKLHADLPMLIASDNAATLGARFADDRCTGVIDKPYNAARMLQALEALGVRCRAKIDRS